MLTTGEVNGRKYSFCGRPELEIHSICNSKYYSDIEIINQDNNKPHEEGIDTY